MPITIGTINDEAAVAKTFTEIAKDRASAEWLNTTDATASYDCRLVIKQQMLGKTQTGIPIRRSLVQCTIKAPLTVTVGGSEMIRQEVVTVNMTITTPEALTALTTAQRRSAVAFVKGLITNSVVDQLVQGQV